MESKRVAIYCRVSTSEQSTANQREELTKYAHSRGWTIYRIFEENISGATGDRPRFKQLMKDAQQRKFDICLCLKLDRMYRSTLGFLSTVETLGALGVSFVSLRDNLDLTTPTGKLMAAVLASVAEFERSLIQQRVQMGVEKAKARGVKFGRPKLRDDSKILALRKQGKSIRQIARELKVSIGAVNRGLRSGDTKVSKNAVA